MTQEGRHGWLLRSRARGDTSLVLELFTLEDGRIDLLAKGGRKNPLLQPFSPLWLTTSGKGSLPFLGKVEGAGARVPLTGEILWCGFYLNELILRLLPDGEPATLLFARYGETLTELAGAGDVQLSLRRFELCLLRECGYELILDQDEQGQPLKASASYQLAAAGLVLSASGFSGADLLGFVAGEWNANIARTSRELLREALARLLGPAPLKSREMLKNLRVGSRPSLDVELFPRRGE